MKFDEAMRGLQKKGHLALGFQGKPKDGTWDCKTWGFLEKKDGLSGQKSSSLGPGSVRRKKSVWFIFIWLFPNPQFLTMHTPTESWWLWISKLPKNNNLRVKDLLVPCVVVADEVNVPSSTRKNRSENFQTIPSPTHPFHFLQAISFWATTSTPKTSCHVLCHSQEVFVKNQPALSCQKTEVSKFGHLRMSWPTWVQRMPCARSPIWESDFLTHWPITAQKSLLQGSSDLMEKYWEPFYTPGKTEIAGWKMDPFWRCM